MTPRLVPLYCGLALLASALPAYADIYAYWDDHGVLNYTNVRSRAAAYRYVTVRAEPNRPRARRASAKPPPAHVEHIVSQAAQVYQVDRALVRAMIQTESAYDTRAVSRKGAAGLMQLMPDTAKRYGVQDVFDPTQNVRGGVQYMRDLLQRFGQDTRLALAAYNAGENAVLRYGGVPPYPETTEYVSRVLRLHQQYRAPG